MAYIVEDRVLETSTTTGTGAFTLAAAVTGYRRLRDICATNDTLPYFIESVDGSGVPTGEWETGIGTYSATDTLTRTTVIRSSNSNAAVNFSAGTKRVGIGLLSLTQKWTQIATATPTGVNTVDFASIPRIYSDLKVVCSGVSHDSASNGGVTLSISPDGSTFASPALIGASIAASGAVYGETRITNYKDDTGCYYGGASSAATSPTIAAPSIGGGWRCTGGISALRLAATSGNFDAGTITLFGR